MTNPPRSVYVLIGHTSPLARRGAQGMLRCMSKHRNAVQRGRVTNRSAAGQFSPTASSFVSHKDAALLPPHSYQQTKIGSVRMQSDRGGLV